MRIIPTLLFVAISISANAQNCLKASGNSARDIVPTGWELQEQTGDLNKDGIADLVVIATPDKKENIMVREDGYQINMNRPILAIYKGRTNGHYSLWKSYEEVLPVRDEFITYDYLIGITDRGVLTIGITSFASAGSWQNSDATYLYRYQNGDFHLIGKDDTNMARNTGETEINSYNYLTFRHQKITYNEFNKSVKRKETWNKLPKTPLEKLGSMELLP